MIRKRILNIILKTNVLIFSKNNLLDKMEEFGFISENYTNDNFAKGF